MHAVRWTYTLRRPAAPRAYSGDAAPCRSGCLSGDRARGLCIASPRCPRCGLLARPNVLMFGDDAWISAPTDAAWSRLRLWLDGLADASLAIVELGAGVDLPAVRSVS